MSDEITQILDRVDGELGRTKTARREPPNLDEFFSGAELNNIADAIRKFFVALGKTDGSTLGSVLRKLRSFSGPRETRCVFFDDMMPPSTVGALGDPTTYGHTLVGAASEVFLEHADAGAGSGVGHLVVRAGDTAGAFGEVVGNHNIFRGSHLLDWKARFKTPSSLTDASVSLGFADATMTTSYARIATSGSAVVRLQSRSGTGLGTSDDVTATSLAPNTWHELRIAITSGRIDFYLNDTLIGSITTVANVPSVAGDRLTQLYARTSRVAAGPHTMLVDWIEPACTRL